VTGSRTGRLAFLAALGLGIAVRVLDLLNCRSLGLDEARTAINVASRNFEALLRPLDLDQTAPPLFLWAERTAWLLGGRTDCALRILPVVFGTVAAMLVYPLARRFLAEPSARFACLTAMFAPLLLTYTNAVKQYSTELLTAVLLLLLFQRAFSSERTRRLELAALAAGAVAPWLALASVFLLACAWVVLAWRALRRPAEALGLALAASIVWGVSGAAVYLAVYRAAGTSPYLHRFWEHAFLQLGRPGFAGDTAKILENLVWGFVAGDPLADRGPFGVLLPLGCGLIVLLCAIGAVRLLRSRGAVASWWVCGPMLATMAASMVGLFPIAPRLILFLLPGAIVLVVAGLEAALERAGVAGGLRQGIIGGVLVAPLACLAVLRTMAMEPPGHFERLVGELRARRAPGEPVYVFARSLPAWIFYSTDWARPDTARLRYLLRAARAGGFAFENSPSRGRVGAEEIRAASPSPEVPGELLGLPSGMEWLEVREHVNAAPDSGWVAAEARRIEGAANPGVWILASTFYVPESELFEVLGRDATRRTYAHLRGGSALVRYEFLPSR
jgi:hypothetical protein